MKALKDLFLDNLVGLQLLGADPVATAKCLAPMFLVDEREAAAFAEYAVADRFAACTDLRILTILKTRHLYSTAPDIGTDEYSELLLDAKERVLRRYITNNKYGTSFDAEKIFATCKTCELAAELTGLGIYFGLVGLADERMGKELLRGAEYTSPTAMLFFLWSEPKREKQQYLDRLSATPVYWRNAAELTEAFVAAYGVEEPRRPGMQTRIGF